MIDEKSIKLAMQAEFSGNYKRMVALLPKAVSVFYPNRPFYLDDEGMWYAPKNEKVACPNNVTNQRICLWLNRMEPYYGEYHSYPYVADIRWGNDENKKSLSVRSMGVYLPFDGTVEELMPVPEFITKMLGLEWPK